MHLIWKRPDGFHGAAPQDFQVYEIGGHSRIWLHKSDKDQYPFRIAGGWEEKDKSVLLNNLINLLPNSDADWLSYLERAMDNSMTEDRATYVEELRTWLGELKAHVKGDTWELEILTQSMDTLSDRLANLKGRFVKP